MLRKYQLVKLIFIDLTLIASEKRLFLGGILFTTNSFNIVVGQAYFTGKHLRCLQFISPHDRLLLQVSLSCHCPLCCGIGDVLLLSNASRTSTKKRLRTCEEDQEQSICEKACFIISMGRSICDWQSRGISHGIDNHWVSPLLSDLPLLQGTQGLGVELQAHHISISLGFIFNNLYSHAVYSPSRPGDAAE